MKGYLIKVKLLIQELLKKLAKKLYVPSVFNGANILALLSPALSMFSFTGQNFKIQVNLLINHPVHFRFSLLLTIKHLFPVSTFPFLFCKI